MPTVFGCACWPNLRPYNSRKLGFRSKQCIFLGYSSAHKGYKCFHRETGRMYISRDVVFDENKFPFAEHTQNLDSPTYVSVYLPLLTPLSSFPSDEPAIDNDHTRDPIISVPNNDASASISAPNLVGSSREASSTSDSGDTLGDSFSSNSSSPLEEVTAPVNTRVHQMRTRLQNNVIQPKKFTDGTVRYPLTGRTAFAAEPSSLPQALAYPRWKAAMDSEFQALQEKQDLAFSTS